MTISPGGRLRAALARLPRDRRGIVAVMVALLIPAFVGLAGLGAETGLWYAIKRQNQAAADEAAISGAMEIVANVADITAQATTTATRNGFNNNAPNTITVTYPYTDLIVSNAVQVVLSQQQSSLFATRTSRSRRAPSRPPCRPRLACWRSVRATRT
jgi:Flp pilus assembly protein TadG